MTENPIVTKARKALISGSKFLPFALCTLIAFSYMEIVFALLTNNFVLYDSYAIPNVPISWFIGKYFEYQIPFVVALLVLVYATKTCVWNKLCCYYIFVALLEKEYFNTIELDVTTIYAICVTNILICCYFSYKGLRMIKK